MSTISSGSMTSTAGMTGAAELRAAALLFGGDACASSSAPSEQARGAGLPPVQVRMRRDGAASPDLLAALAIFADAGVRTA